MKLLDWKQLSLPKGPGVYFFKNKQKEILYIGKATNLSDRTKSYFGKDLGDTRGQHLIDMVNHAEYIETESTDSVLEALLLESSLIKKHSPPYNTKEKDNKSYYFVVITDEAFPRVFVERERVLQFTEKLNYTVKSKYGPFPQGQIITEALRIIRRLFPFRDKKSLLKHHARFYESLGLSPQNKEGGGLENEAVKRYKKNINYIEKLFKGEKKEIILDITKNMEEAARDFDFEKAGFFKKQLYAINHIHDISLLKRDFFKEAREGSVRIEAYDIAHMGGRDMVGVMVVIQDGMAQKSEYRKFIIKTRTTADDTASLDEVLRRRFKHKEWLIPHLVVIDGGKAQLARARLVKKELELPCEIVSVLKDEHHKAREILGGVSLIKKYKDEILLANSESHRFALLYHTEKRKKTFKNN